MPGTVLEIEDDTGLFLVQPQWASDFPWLVQGTTVRGPDDEPFDLGLFSGGRPAADVRRDWERLLDVTRCATAVHARQVHGAEVRVSDAADLATPASSPESVPRLVEACDGHLTDLPGVLLGVATADCVPVFLVDPGRRVVGAVHAGWRGVAAGVFERALSIAAGRFGSRAADLHVHLGPAICGACYEVGPEVFEALGQSVPGGPTPIDLRAVLRERAVRSGIDPDRVSISGHCTRCTGSGLFSHRGGDRHRQIGFIAARGGDAGR